MEQRQSAWRRSAVKSATSWYHLFSELRCQHRAHGEQRRSRGGEGGWGFSGRTSLFTGADPPFPTPRLYTRTQESVLQGKRNTPEGPTPSFVLPASLLQCIWYISLSTFPSDLANSFTTCIASPIATLQGILVAHGRHLSPLSSLSDLSSNTEHKALLSWDYFLCWFYAPAAPMTYTQSEVNKGNTGYLACFFSF